MVYNRCVGTRYCSNNCPYKVRRFNFLPSRTGHGEPETGPKSRVTVRSRGVMEKCTYCVQRIRSPRLRQSNGTRNGRVGPQRFTDGEIVTACQAACPSQGDRFRRSLDVDSEKEIINPATGVKHKVKGSDVRPLEGGIDQLRPAGGAKHDAANRLILQPCGTRTPICRREHEMTDTNAP